MEDRQNMKLIMENWRGYMSASGHGELFERHEYISGVLGIRLPLNESGQVQLNEELKEHILQEHILFEGFLGSIIDGVTEKTGQIKDLFLTLTQILSSPDRIQTFVYFLSRKVIKKFAKPFRAAFNKMKEVGGAVAEFASKISDAFEMVIQTYAGMEMGWKKAMAGAAIGVLLSFVYEKMKKVINDVIKEFDPKSQVAGHFIEFLKTEFVKFFGEDLVANILGQVTDIKKYLGWLGSLVGGVAFVAKTLVPVTSRMVDPGALEKFGQALAAT